MNHLAGSSGLRNRYFAMRHGRSLANEAGRIVSSPEDGILDAYGLSDSGVEQVERALDEPPAGLGPATLVVCSDFSRARQTAAIAGRRLGTEAPATTAGLRERYFGAFDGGPDRAYTQVWAADAEDPGRAPGGAEPAADVLERTTRLIAGLEERHRGRTFLLVSHGDPLQILQCAFLGLDPRWHRTLPPLDVSEIRRLDLR